jgi:hypothetical protein
LSRECDPSRTVRGPSPLPMTARDGHVQKESRKKGRRFFYYYLKKEKKKENDEEQNEKDDTKTRTT